MAEYETAPEVAMGTVKEYALDDSFYVKFYKHAVPDVLLTEGGTLSKKHPRYKELLELGREMRDDPDNRGYVIVEPSERPHYREVEFVRIMRLGDRDTVWDRPVEDSDRKRFASRYDAWKKGEDAELLEGTPLTEVPWVNAAQREEFAHFHVRTVEQLAGLPEGVASKFMGIKALQERARAWLDAAKGKKDEAKLDAKLAERDARIAALEAELRKRAPKAPRRAAPETARG